MISNAQNYQIEQQQNYNSPQNTQLYAYTPTITTGGTLPVTNNATLNQSSPNYQYYPYYIQSQNSITSLNGDFSITKVENGWVVYDIKNTKFYVCVNKEDIINFL